MSVVFSFPVKSRASTVTPSKDRGEYNGIFLKGTGDSMLILVHGLTGTPNEMKYLANFFNKRGYSVAVPRLANHGEPIDVLKGSKWQDFYASVKDIFINGPARDHKGPIFISGLSMGALLALLIADEFKEKVTAVSCLAVTLFYDGWNTPASSFFLPLGYNTPLKYFAYFKEEPPYGVKNEAIRERIHKYYSNAKLDDMSDVAQYGYPYFPVTLLYQLQLIVKELKKKLPGIDRPVQLIQAKDDDMASIKNSKYIYDRIGSREKEMVFLYDSYHVITADHERDVVADNMESFFSRAKDVRS